MMGFNYFSLYIGSVFTLVSFIYLNYFSEIFPYDKDALLKEHQEINNMEVDFKLDKQVLIYLAFLGSLGFIFNVTVGKIYFLYIIVSVCASLLSYKLSDGIPTFIINFIKKLRRDRVTMKYHWYTDFKTARSYIHISFVSLTLCVVIIVMISPIYFMEPSVSEINNKLWLLMFTLHCCVGFSIDTYIIFFKNTPAEAPLVGFCKTCLTYGLPIISVNQQGVNNEVTQPNGVSNGINKLTGNPAYVDREQVSQHRVMLKYYPNVPESAYLEDDTGSWFGGKKFSTPKALGYVQEHPEPVRGFLTSKECRDMKLDASFQHQYPHGSSWKR